MAGEPPTPIRIPKPLPPWQAAGYTCLFVLCTTAFILSLAGLFVLTDYDNKTWLGQTTFAEKYRQLMRWNQMTSALCFNGGAVGAVTSFVQLRRHRQAKLLKNVRFLRPQDVVTDSRVEKKKRR